ncbi:MAG: prepilin-type N-terminal cleavage/methylation domain-containing protein [Puniceicoccales bacterium]|jgi:prepilin-type N-terminal cleavage/methylation domain-containing protein|nr:prepilin-type N-terminal cleavage/methylation domain-containing protein [Puniceicoccales bacterium]
MAFSICQSVEYFQHWDPMGQKDCSSGFTLIELVAVIALVSASLFFLVKLNVTSGNENQQVKAATLLLASGFDSARGQAIAGNTYAKVVIDTSSNLMFRRVVLMKQSLNIWVVEREILLPERTFILPLDRLSEWLGGDNLSAYAYLEEEAIVQGTVIDGYHFTFNPEGRLSDSATAILGIGYGTKVNNGIKFKKDINIYGLFITSAGQGVILDSKNAIKGAI